MVTMPPQLTWGLAMLGRILVIVVFLAATVIGVAPSVASATPVCTKSIAYQGRIWVMASSANSIDCHTQRGNVSNAVVQLQHTMNTCYETQLRNAGVFPLAVDGNFGGNTEKAMKAVQGSIGTSADGVYGPNTRNAMRFIHIEAFPLRCYHF